MSEYTELVERAEFAATSAKNSAAQTKSDKDTVVSLYNEIKAIIDAGGGGGSCKFYECSAVIEQSEGGILVSGITGLYGYSDDEVNGLYTYGELTDCVATTGYTHEKGKMWIYKHPNYVFWLITYSKQAPDPGTSIAYCRGEASANPWELAWELNSGSGTVVVEQAPPADASWSGYEWSLEGTAYEKSTTITEGLAWTSVKPEIGKTYTEDALVEIASLYQSEDNGGTEEPEEPTPDEPEVEPTKQILVAAGFDETGYLAGTNGEYELLDVSATGTAREWHCSDNNMRIVWTGSVWCIAPKDNMMYEVATGDVTDPWDTTWYFMGNAISGATVTKKSDSGNGGSGE